MCPSGMSLNDHKECVQTAESLQPPPDSGHVRRSSDVGLESRTGAQRRRSMAPGLEGGSGGGSATSLHRSSSMKQQRSGSFNTGTLPNSTPKGIIRTGVGIPSLGFLFSPRFFFFCHTRLLFCPRFYIFATLGYYSILSFAPLGFLIQP